MCLVWVLDITLINLCIIDVWLKGGDFMKKRRVVKSRKAHRVHHTSRVRTQKLIWGLEPDFIMILGGGFLVVVLGMMILYR